MKHSMPFSYTLRENWMKQEPLSSSKVVLV
jgi:hypothetical protein